MKVLVTGAKGFVGSNLCAALRNIRDNKDQRKKYQSLMPLTIYEYDVNNTAQDLDKYCSDADFVFNLAGVNRPKNQSDFMKGNFEFAEQLLKRLEKHGNTCPVMLSSSIQATLKGRYERSEYGESKLAGEALFQDYGKRTGAKVLIYRFPNLYGKWCRPNYNSVVATFCNNIATGLPIQISDRATKLDLLYIDDLVHEMLEALLGHETYCDDGFCYPGKIDHVTLGEIADLLHFFKSTRNTHEIPDMTEEGFTKKLYSTYVSYLNPKELAYSLQSKSDDRGSFAELFKSPREGQISINVTKPGQVKGQHWHHTKWEKFLVVSGEGVIRVRRVGLQEDGSRFPIFEYKVNGEDLCVVDIPTGYVHSLTNASSSEDMVAIVWSNEIFDPKNPDTYSEEV